MVERNMLDHFSHISNFYSHFKTKSILYQILNMFDCDSFIFNSSVCCILYSVEVYITMVLYIYWVLSYFVYKPNP